MTVATRTIAKRVLVSTDKPLSWSRFFHAKKPKNVWITVESDEEQEMSAYQYVVSGKSDEESENDAILEGSDQVRSYLDSLK